MVVDVQARQRKIKHLQKALENLGQMEKIHNGFRSAAPHFAGGFDEERVFGGHLLAQFYMAIRSMAPVAPSRMDVTFLGAASTSRPIEYTCTEQKGPFMFIDAKQEDRLVDRAVVRLQAEQGHVARRFANPPRPELQSVPRPETCEAMEDALRAEVIDPALANEGPGYDFMFSKQNRELFEVRFTDPSHLKCNGGVIRNWMRLRKELRDVPVNDPMLVPLLISDYFACLPLTVFTERTLTPIDTVASLNHKVILHTDKCDPSGWFLLELDMDSSASTGLVLGRVAAEDGTPILNFAQQFLVQLDDRPKL